MSNKSFNNYRSSQLKAGQTPDENVDMSETLHFAEYPLLAAYEVSAKTQGLGFMNELVFENGAVYKGKVLVSGDVT